MAGRKTQAETQRVYRDRKRQAPPRPYRQKPLVENSVWFKIQDIVQFAYSQHITSWNQATPFGIMPIRVSSVENPHWLQVGNIQFRLSKWEAMGGILDRWTIIDEEGKRRTKIHVLPDRRFGCRNSLGLVYQKENRSKKIKRAVKLRKMTEGVYGCKRSVRQVKKRRRRRKQRLGLRNSNIPQRNA